MPLAISGVSKCNMRQTIVKCCTRIRYAAIARMRSDGPSFSDVLNAFNFIDAWSSSSFSHINILSRSAYTSIYILLILCGGVSALFLYITYHSNKHLLYTFFFASCSTTSETFILLYFSPFSCVFFYIYYICTFK